MNAHSNPTTPWEVRQVRPQPCSQQLGSFAFRDDFGPNTLSRTAPARPRALMMR